MKFKIILYFLCALVVFGAISFANEKMLTLNEIMDKVEKKYDVVDFSSYFIQESTMKAMDITDVASGTIFVKRPGMMRWEYDKPDRQTIITDGKKLWVYKPDDNQVMIGKAPSFFGDGKGAGFLSDMKLIREKFTVYFEKINNEHDYVIKLLPKEQTIGIAKIYLAISKTTFKIKKIITQNEYEDENVIELINSKFNLNLDKSLFRFIVPEGTDVIRMDE
ncbi:MAG: outer membrane lipoprotein carrier protein LolA [Desulfobacterales bacterium]|nr:outer membrane lipoprotein carrier protein LolA [Deltaproteobacteria bacterium]NNL42982.1 outer membrane lipoprotein carrier protein LolA [Desulfobacterales bacterium]